jgi:hypothetical protein
LRWRLANSIFLVAEFPFLIADISILHHSRFNAMFDDFTWIPPSSRPKSPVSAAETGPPTKSIQVLSVTDAKTHRT